MARNGTDVLQDKVDQTSRAQERIDADPEEAAAVLQPLVDPSAGQLTLHDVLGLFLQMQQQQTAMQQQLIELVARQGQAETRRTAAHTREEIAQAQEQQRKTLDAWKTEPRLPVFLEATPDEKKIFAIMGEFPPRMHRVNGLEFPIKVGEVVNVPESIHAQITWAQTYAGNQRRPAQAIQLIADPQRGQFLAGSQSISPGKEGLVGEGPLLVTGIAHSTQQAQPLDLRYDHEGR